MKISDYLNIIRALQEDNFFYNYKDCKISDRSILTLNNW